jgi:T5SS/PEP-CTERM-associated repeat protein
MAGNRKRLLAMLVLSMGAGVSPAHAANLIWTNTAASGSFQDAKVWQPNGPPGGTDTANFTNSLTYTVNFSASALNDSAFVGAFKGGSAGSLTLNIGSGLTWTLTNVFRIATNSANANANGMTVTLSSGTLAVTNSAGAGLVNIGEVGTGTFILNGGTLIADNLLATNLVGAALKSTLSLISGTLTTLHGSSISNKTDFVIGGTSGQQVTWNIQGGTNRVSLTAGNNVILGNTATSSGDSVLVSGANTAWIDNRSLIVGNNGFSNNVTVSAGAFLDSSGAILGSGGSGGQGNSNTVIVTGANSVWTNRGTLVLGSVNGSFNTVTISAGGNVFNNDVTIGSGGAGGRANSNLVFVTGTGSRWITLGDVSLGAAMGGSFNMLVVTNSGFASASGNLVIGANADPGQQALVTSNGLVDVAGSVLIGNGSGDGNGLQLLDQGTLRSTNVVVGPNGATSGNTITNSGGSLLVTNSTVTATLNIQHGAVALNSGTVSVDKLILTTGSSGTLVFNGGNLNVSSAFVTNTFAFVVGDGAGNTATLNLLGGVYNFNNGLTNRTDGFITGGGGVNSPFQVVNLGSIVATSTTAELRFTNTTTVGNPGTLGASTGATLTFGTAGVGSAIITNLGTISLTGGTLRSGNITNLAAGFIGGSGTLVAAVGNSGAISATGGDLILSAGLIGNTNSGTLSAAVGGNLIIGTASNLVVNNSATINLSGGNLFSGNVTNLAGATLRGRGALKSLLVNAGTVTATNGELRLLGAASGAGAYRAVAGASASTLSFVGGGSISALFNTGATIRVEGALTNANTFINAGSLVMAGGTYQSSATVTNISGSWLTGTGTVAATTLNSGTIFAHSATPLTFSGPSLNNLVGGVVTASTASLVVKGAFNNSGTFVAISSVGTFSGGVVNSGAWITDPSTNVFQNTYTVTSSGFIQMTPGDVYIFSNNASAASFVNLSTQSNTFHTLPGKFLFDATLALTQTFATAGNNIGNLNTTGGFTTVTVPTLNPNLLAQYSNNFALGSLELASTTTVVDAFLQGGRTHGGLEAALFLSDLTLDPGSLLIISNDVQIYFITSNAFNLAQVSLLGDGGLHQLVTQFVVVPEPDVLLLWLAGAAAVYGSRRRNRPPA